MASAAVSPHPRPLALIVDDHADTREMYAFQLRREGVSVVEASSGGQALETAAALRPDVITTDLSFANASGVDLCRQLKALDATRTIPIIIVTGRAMPEEIDEARSLGCAAVLVKPCLPATLLAEIRRVLSS